MLEKAKQLLAKHLDKEKLYLLAFSGGSDSMALFLLLKEIGINFFAVHVDHGWREESALEAEKLRDFAKEENVPFTLLSLEKEVGGNLEAKAREGRYRLFANLYKEVGASALLLGHHSDDLVETIIKRVFEGSALNHLSFKEISCQNAMVCLRPLIQQTKEEIRAYLAAKKMWHLEDRTNSDLKFLRARMRLDLLPMMEASFGKGIRENILSLGRKAEAVTELLEERVEASYKSVKKGVFGLFLPLQPLPELALEHLLRKIFKDLDIVPLRSEIERLLLIIKEDRNGKGIEKSSWKIVLDQKRLFFIRKVKWAMSIREGVLPLKGWQELWEGEVGVEVLSDKMHVGPPKLTASLPNGWELKEWYRVHHVPTFLREETPVLWEGERLVGEFLVPKKGDERGNYVLKATGKE
ncbi:MAG: tRNA lysidine(34) synthetase TilS [Verrucomicrobia bacterium]|nr:tRNA lysidine(34) synthetase TilS [Verrucomicrobiota bacterium]